MLLRRLLLVFSLILCAAPAFALDPGEALPDPHQEARARDLFRELRCMVCQNESIDESNAPLAKDLRMLVRDHLKSGEDEDTIKRYLVERYGDFVLLSPPLEERTLLLWGGPLIVLAGGAAGVAFALRKRRKGALSAVDPLSDAEQQELQAYAASGE